MFIPDVTFSFVTKLIYSPDLKKNQTTPQINSGLNRDWCIHLPSTVKPLPKIQVPQGL